MKLTIGGKTIFSFNEPKAITPEVETMPVQTKQDPQAYYGDRGGYVTGNAWVYSYDGEKNQGELGPAKILVPDHERLSIRGWQLHLESEICHILSERKKMWTIGTGLRLQCAPQMEVLNREKVAFNAEEWSKAVEALWNVEASTKMFDYAEQRNMRELMAAFYDTKDIGGNCLTVLRYIDGCVKIQLIDGCHVRSPLELSFNPMTSDRIAANGNRVRHGVELDDRGRHVAYYLCKGPYGMEYERIPAKSPSTGLTVAWMGYGMRYRLDSTRGLPKIAPVMETAKKMERYKEAALGKAEEQAKIVIAIEHEAGTGDENPLAQQMAKSVDIGNTGGNSRTVDGKELTSSVTATTNKQSINLPEGAKITTLTSTGDPQFTEFYGTNGNIVFATGNIPPEVALQKYDSNFSSARAAIKDWEHTVLVDREDMETQFGQYVYEFWLHVRILENKIDAKGYLQAFAEKNAVVLAAYRMCRFVGDVIPHIDPLKEVKAIREKLGDLGKNLPLTTLEQAIEDLNGWNSSDVLRQFARELAEAKAQGIKPSEPNPGNNNTPPDEEEEDTPPPVKKPAT